MHNQFGIAYARLGRPGGVAAVAGAPLETFERLTSEHPDIVPLQSQLALTLGHVGAMHQALGHRDAARRGRPSGLACSWRIIPARARRPVQPGVLPHHMAVLADDGAGGRLSPGRDLGHQQAEAAMTALRRAIAAGYKNLPDMIRDPDLDPLRSRSDFQLLMMDLAMPAVPFALIVAGLFPASVDSMRRGWKRGQEPSVNRFLTPLTVFKTDFFAADAQFAHDFGVVSLLRSDS